MTTEHFEDTAAQSAVLNVARTMLDDIGDLLQARQLLAEVLEQVDDTGTVNRDLGARIQALLKKGQL